MTMTRTLTVSEAAELREHRTRLLDRLDGAAANAALAAAANAAARSAVRAAIDFDRPATAADLVECARERIADSGIDGDARAAAEAALLAAG